MITSSLVVCAETVLRDAETNRMSTINIFEDMTPAGFPFLIPRFSILAILQRSEEDEDSFDSRLRLTLDDQVLYEGPARVEFTGKRTTRAIIVISGLVINQPGTFTTTLFLGDRVLGEYKFPLTPALAPTATVEVVA